MRTERLKEHLQGASEIIVQTKDLASSYWDHHNHTPYRQLDTYSVHSAVDAHAHEGADTLQIHPPHPAAAVLPLAENTHYNNLGYHHHHHHHHHTAVHYAQTAIVAVGQPPAHHYHMEGHKVVSGGEEAGFPTVGPAAEDFDTRSYPGLDPGLRIHIGIVAPGSGREG